MTICNKILQARGDMYPRTCRKCGLGPCQDQAKPSDFKIDWESLDAGSTYRAKIEGGWLYRYQGAGHGTALVFVPEEPVTVIAVGEHQPTFI